MSANRSRKLQSNNYYRNSYFTSIISTFVLLIVALINLAQYTHYEFCLLHHHGSTLFHDGHFDFDDHFEDEDDYWEECYDYE